MVQLLALVYFFAMSLCLYIFFSEDKSVKLGSRVSECVLTLASHVISSYNSTRIQSCKHKVCDKWVEMCSQTHEPTFPYFLLKNQKELSPAGFEPATFGLEVQRAIHCANGTPGILGSAFSKFIEYTRYWRLDTIYSSRY